MSIKRILTLVFYAIVLIVAIIGFSQIFISENVELGTSILLNFTIGLLVLIILSTFLASPVLAILANPKGFVKSLIGAGVLLVIFGIGYAIAGDEVTRATEAMGIDTASKSKLIGGVINTVFILIVLGVLSYIYSSISSLIKQL